MSDGDLGPGLSDFGLSAPSEANSVGADTSQLEALLGGLPNMPFEDIQRAEGIKDRMGEVAGLDVPGHLEQLLKSPRGIAALLGTLGVGLGGGGLEGAAAFGLGATGPVLSAKGEAEQEKADKLDELSGRLNDQEEKILKRQQMIQTAIQNAPDQFIDPETGELSVPPQIMGYLAYGMPLAANPSSKRILNRRDKAWEAQAAGVADALKAVGSVEDAAVLIGSLNRLLDNPNPDPAEDAALARAFGTEGWESALVGHYINNGGVSAQKALLYAAENDLPLEHPEVIKRLDFSQGADSMPPSQRLNDKFITLMDRVRVWEANPANATMVAKFETDAETPEERNRLVYTAALGNAADVGFYEQKVGAMPSYVSRRLQAQYNANIAGWGLTETVLEARNIPTRQGMSPGEVSTAKANETVQGLIADERAVIEDERKKLTGWTSQQTSRLVGSVGGMSHGRAKDLVQQCWNIASRENPGAPQDVINQKAMAKVTALIEQNANK